MTTPPPAEHPPNRPWVELNIIRVRSGYSLRTLATASGYTKNFLHMCEQGQRSPSPETVHTLAAILRVPFPMLLPHEHPIDPVEFEAQVDRLDGPSSEPTVAPAVPVARRRGRRREPDSAAAEKVTAA